MNTPECQLHIRVLADKTTRWRDRLQLKQKISIEKKSVAR